MKIRISKSARIAGGALTLAALLGASGCKSRETTAEQALAIVGSYQDNYGSQVTITEDTYSEQGDGYELEYEIVSFDNDAQFFVVRDTSAEEGAQYLKYVWVDEQGDIYNCVAIFGAESEAAASEPDEADRSDLEMGCSGFAWSLWTPAGDGKDAG